MTAYFANLNDVKRLNEYGILVNPWPPKYRPHLAGKFEIEKFLKHAEVKTLTELRGIPGKWYCALRVPGHLLLPALEPETFEPGRALGEDPHPYFRRYLGGLAEVATAAYAYLEWYKRNEAALGGEIARLAWMFEWVEMWETVGLHAVTARVQSETDEVPVIVDPNPPGGHAGWQWRPPLRPDVCGEIGEWSNCTRAKGHRLPHLNLERARATVPPVEVKCRLLITGLAEHRHCNRPANHSGPCLVWPPEDLP